MSESSTAQRTIILLQNNVLELHYTPPPTPPFDTPPYITLFYSRANVDKCNRRNFSFGLEQRQELSSGVSASGDSGLCNDSSLVKSFVSQQS
jgi:hypothetical protein